MQYLRFFVEHFADAMTAVFTHHGKLLGFDEFLDLFAQGAQADARLHHFQRQIQAFLGNAAQPLAQNGRLADDEHLGGIAVEAIFNDGHVDIDDVAVLQHFVIARDAVAHHFVYRDAHGFREAVVAEAGGDGLLLVGNVLVTDTVQFAGGHARFDVRLDNFQHFSGQAARHAHFLDVIRCFN
ncbi:hypothetical protein D3C79_553820 [compost metagenome]